MRVLGHSGVSEWKGTWRPPSWLNEILMKCLLDKRTSVSVGDAKGLAKATWPFGRIKLLEDRIFLNAGFKSFELLYSEIKRIRYLPFQVQIEHKSQTVPEHVDLNGFLIPKHVRQAIAAHNLPVRTN
jgi:hypothetical protein